jgi:hypothetical protein
MAGARETFSQVTAYDTEIFGTMLMFIGTSDYGTEYVIEVLWGNLKALFHLETENLWGPCL